MSQSYVSISWVNFGGLINPIWAVPERVCDVQRTQKPNDPTLIINFTKYMNPFKKIKWAVSFGIHQLIWRVQKFKLNNGVVTMEPRIVSVSNIWWCFPPRSRFRFYSLLLLFWSHIVFELVLIKYYVWSRKNMAAHWHCCGSVNHFTVSFSKNALMRRRTNEGALSQGKAWGRKRGGGGGTGRAESRLYCCVFSQRQQQRKWNGAAKYTNSTMRQRAWSSCGTWPSPSSGVWNTEGRLIYTGRADWVHAAFQIHLHIQTVNTGSYTIARSWCLTWFSPLNLGLVHMYTGIFSSFILE